MTAILKTYSIVGNIISAMHFDSIVTFIQPITGAYIGLTGNLIQCTYATFHDGLQKKIALHPPKNGDYYFIEEPHSADRTFDNVLYVVDDGSLPLSTCTERLLIEMVKHHCSVVGLPLLRYEPKTADATTEAMLKGIHNFQNNYNAPLHIYMVLGSPNSLISKRIYDETKFCGEWNAGKVIL